MTDQVVVEQSYNGGVESEPVVRASLSNQVAERLRNDIVNRRILPGARLVQDELCQRYGTSRMPVRDALRQLTHEGILERQGHQLVVASLGVEDLEEVHSLTAVLHGWAAGQAAKAASDAELAELADICQTGLETDDPFEFGRLSMEFHRKINLLAHSQRLIRTLIFLERTRPRTTPIITPGDMAPSKASHQAIMAAILSRDAELAERLTRSLR